MKFVYAIASLLALLLVAGTIQADHKRSRCSAASCWSSNTAASPVAVQDKKEPVQKPNPVETVTPANQVAAGSCASGTCGTASVSRFSRRGR